MQVSWRWAARPSRAQSVPTDICISLVDSLYKDHRSLFIGSFAASMSALISAWKTGEPLLYLCSLSLVVVAIARMIDCHAYSAQRAELRTSAGARKWERRYVVGAACYVALLGIWCLVSFSKTADPFVQLLSFSMTLAYLIGVSGRNFASRPLVTSQIVCAGLPMGTALLAMGNAYYSIFAFVLIPFLMAVKLISERLRTVLLDAVIAGRHVSLLADRFDTALNNMPHGLCMFDADRRLAVINRRLFELLGVPTSLTAKRTSPGELILASVRGGTLSSATGDQLMETFERRVSGVEIGELMVETESGNTLALTFQPMDNGGSVVLVQDITERKMAEAKINQLARYDALTGLPNRAHFRDHMDKALATVRHRGPFAVHFIDLDQFKQVNDTLGHPCGDELLCAVAERLRLLCRDSDVITRFGGDEFLVLQSPVHHSKEAGAFADRIVEELAKPFDITGHHIVIGASVGIALAPKDGSDADVLLRNADMALYRAKGDGRSGWRFFEHAMDVSAQARRSLQLDLRNALASNAFTVYYQPIMNLRTHRISTCEALLRWPHPVHGMISPADFIPVAEEIGLIVDIGAYVLQQACMECARWPGNVRVAVNMSPIQFRRGGVTEAVQHALAKSGLPAHRLEIEITESVFLHDTMGTRACINELRALGVRIALDDFGTGYSSLSYLHSFPLNKVKIDRSFLQDVETSDRSMTLLAGVARLSADLKLSVVVEGIETEEQLALVSGEPSVEEAQGFLIGAAVPDREIRARLYSPLELMGRVA